MHVPESVQINDSCVQISSSAKCLGVWWQHDLLAKHSVAESINKARKAFFTLGSLGAFQGELNPLSSKHVSSLPFYTEKKKCAILTQKCVSK